MSLKLFSKISERMESEITTPWEPPSTPAQSLEEAAQRFVEAAASIKAILSLGREPGKWALQVQFANEMLLKSLDLGHQVVTGQPLPDEFQLGPGEHFGKRHDKPRL